jgi:sigma-E factor negative regulatory protein RseB
MLSRFVRALVAFCMAGAVATAGAASDEGRGIDARDVRGWLMRIHEAAHKRNFQGTFVVTSAGTVASSRITHFSDGPRQLERIDSLDGRMRRVLRHDDVVYTLWPDSRTAVVEQRDLLTTFPALLQAGHDHLASFYDVRTQGTERVAGHDANVLLVVPKDHHRYGYRLWAERSTDLLLRAEVLGDRHEVLEVSAFSEVAIGVKPQLDSIVQLMRKLDGWRVVRPVLTPTRLDAEGWTLKQPVVGFDPVSCVRRPLPGTAPASAETAADAVQAIYADGLTYVSIFVERYDAARHVRQGPQTAVGATQTLMRRQGSWWITVVGDVPASTLGLFADALEHRP